MYYQLISSMNKVAPSLYTARTTAFASATAITDTTILNALNTFDLGLISNSLDTKMKALYPFVGGTASTHKFNFMNAVDSNGAFRLQFSGGFTHSSTGCLPNGTNAYANTFLTPNTILNLNSHSFGVYSRTENTSEKVYGCWDTVNFLQNNFNGNFISGSFGNIVYYTASPSKKLILLSRTANNLATAYRNGTSIGTNTSAITASPSNNFCLFARLDGATPGLFTSNELAFAFLSDGLNSTEITNFNNLVNALQTSLSRNV